MFCFFYVTLVLNVQLSKEDKVMESKEEKNVLHRTSLGVLSDNLVTL